MSAEPSFEEVDAYVAGLEDASFAPLIGRECPSCGGSGYATTLDGRTLGTCSTCNGFGGVAVTEKDGGAVREHEDRKAHQSE